MIKSVMSVGVIGYRIVDNEPLYLLLYAAKGFWGFPKGKVEAGETAAATALRELEEETGLSVDLDISQSYPLRYRFSEQGVVYNKKVMFFTGRLREGVVTLSKEHQRYEWLNAENIAKQITHNEERKAFCAADKYIRGKLEIL